MAEVVIVGGGLAGSAAAIVLAKAGREVLLIEREWEAQHKVCGEFLSEEALASLRLLGIEPAAMGACPIRSVRLADGPRVMTGDLPFKAMSMTRKRLDEALLEHAEEAGAYVARGTRVLQVQKQKYGWSLVVESYGAGETEAGRDEASRREDHAEEQERHIMAAKHVFLATGKYDLTGRPRPSGAQRGMVGFKMYYRLRPEQAADLEGHIDLMLFEGGYGGLQLVEDGLANFGWIVEKRVLKRHGGRWEGVVAAMQRECPHLAERLQGAEPMLERALAVGTIPYGFVRPSARDGIWSVGDQAAVIPSFTGDGMAIALHSGQLAAAMYLAGETADAYQRRLHDELEKQVGLATVLSRGLVWGPSRAALLKVVRAWPKLLEQVARRTRIAENVRLA